MELVITQKVATELVMELAIMQKSAIPQCAGLVLVSFCGATSIWVHNDL